METSMVESTVWNLGNEMAVVKVAMKAASTAYLKSMLEDFS